MRWFAALLLAGCAGPKSPVAAPARKPSPAPLPAMIRGGLLLPQIDPVNWQPRFRIRDADQYLVAGLRVAVHDDGSIERGTERFVGGVDAIELPERFGSGYVFYESDGRSTKLWRAASWTGSLEPLSALTRSTDEVMVGFDRLYLHGGGRLVAVDADDGRLRPLGNLPPAGALGSMAFADGWRAVVDADLRGPLATFDAGFTWRPVPIAGAISAIGIGDSGDPVIDADSGSYRLDARGQLELTVRPSAPAASDGAPQLAASAASGSRLLRLAILHGYPDGAATAVLVDRGKLVRVSLPDGRLVEAAPVETDPLASCQGVRMGDGIGFVCGVDGGPTWLYALEAGSSLRLTKRFAEPRFVAASGRGWLAVRGGCALRQAAAQAKPLLEPASRAHPPLASSPLATPSAAPHPEVKAANESYCLLDGRGGEREIAVRGELGSERVVALHDGRAAVLVPPRFYGSASDAKNPAVRAPGRLSIVSGASVTSAELILPTEPHAAADLARHGLWLEGVRETDTGALQAWVEGGGRVLGVEIGLDGTVELGRLYDRGGDVLFSGRFALALPPAEVGYQSIDGGKSWQKFALPKLPDSPSAPRNRGCSPVGCAIRGWLRAGWFDGDAQADLQLAPEPKVAVPDLTVAPAQRLACHLGRPKERPAEAAPDAEPSQSWSAFVGRPPPKLDKGEVGVDKGTFYQPVQAHAYVWGQKGADWSRAGWWQLMFDDRFGADAGVHATARTRPPWIDADTAADAIGARRNGSYWLWHALLDSGGASALVSICQQGVAMCAIYSAVEGEPIVPLRVPPLMMRPADLGAARIGDAWFFLLDRAPAGLELWRADSSSAAMIARYRRVTSSRSLAAPGAAVSLVRRAEGGALGLLVTVPPDESAGSVTPSWIVLPIQAEDGALGDPIALGPAAPSPPLSRCEPHEEGWLIETSLAASTAVTFVDAWGYLDDFEYRLRADAGHACVDAIAARASRGITERPDAKWSPPKGVALIPLSVADAYATHRWGFECYPAK